MISEKKFWKNTSFISVEQLIKKNNNKYIYEIKKL